ncbi:MAG: hypothetical protein PGN13_10945 [Patulibacter minatonensis]
MQPPSSTPTPPAGPQAPPPWSVGRRVAAAAIAALAVAGSVAVVVSRLPSEQARPAWSEAADLAADEQVSQASAQRALDDQRLTSELDETLRRRLGAAYGGLWVEHTTTTRIAIASAERPVLATRVEQEARAAGIEGPVRVAWNRPSYAALVGNQRRMEREVRAMNEPVVRRKDGWGTTIDVEADLVRGLLLITPPKRPNGLQARYLGALPSEVDGVPVRIGAPVRISWLVRERTSPTSPVAG